LGYILNKKDWNEEFQKLVDQGLGLADDSTTRDKQQSVNENFGQLVREFTALAGVLTTVIVAERGLEPKARLITPIDDTGAGGQKFLTHNIFIKFAIMQEECRLYHSEEEQAKASELELKSLNAYMRYSMRIASQARFPLMSMFDYRGLRLTATPCLPLKEIIYGSADRAKTIHASVPEFNEIMRTLGHEFNIKSHWVYSNEAKTLLEAALSQLQVVPPEVHHKYTQPPFAAELVGCGDIEGHLGKDNRFYLLDTARLCPPTASKSHYNGVYFPNIKGSFLCRMFRPEFLRQHLTPLSSDVFCKWADNPLDSNAESQNNGEVVDATLVLEQETIPAATNDIDQTYSPFMLQSSPFLEEDQLLREIIVDLHSRGVNVRYLGLVRSHLPPNSPLRLLLLTEMIARVVKSYMNVKMRSLETTDFIKHQQLICDLFNMVFLTAPTESPFWRSYFMDQLFHKFGPLALSSLDRKDVGAIYQQVQWMTLFERIQHMTQILWKEDAKLKIKSGSDFLVESDILMVNPRAKHLFVVAKQIASYAQQKNKPQEGTSFVKIKLGREIINTRPQWRHVLNKWLEAVERYPSDGDAICNWTEVNTAHKLYFRDETLKERARAKEKERGRKDNAEFGITHTYALSFAIDSQQNNSTTSTLTTMTAKSTPTGSVYWSAGSTNWLEEAPVNLFARDLSR